MRRRRPRDTQIDGNNLPPCPYVRRTFTVGKPLRQATIFATARGLYELHLNGAKVGDAVLAPGWTDYRKRIEYQAYDVTAALHPGVNAVGAILGDGWYSGYVGFARQRNLYGIRPELRLQINIEYADGTRQIVGDRRNMARHGPARSPTRICCKANRMMPAGNWSAGTCREAALRLAACCDRDAAGLPAHAADRDRADRRAGSEQYAFGGRRQRHRRRSGL